MGTLCLPRHLLQGGPWRKKATDLDGTEDEKDLPWWCIDCVLHGRLSQRENAKYVGGAQTFVHSNEGVYVELCLLVLIAYFDLCIYN